MFALLVVSVMGFVYPDPPAVSPWEKEIAGIEKRLKEKPPAKQGVLFAGSSSIRLWNLEKSFPGAGYINVGFGGSEVRDTTQFADRIILPFEPRTIVFYAGDNDIAKGRTPEQVRDDFAALVKTIRGKLPKVKIIFLPVKPSPKRWALYDKQVVANRLVKQFCEAGEGLTYVDIVTPMLGADGKPRPELFVKDELHMSDAGYAIWTSKLVELLKP